MIGIIGAIAGDIIGCTYEFNSTRDYNFKLLTNKSLIKSHDSNYINVCC